jgi:ERCC4-related helicase
LSSFNRGDISILVATCIAEEGLDIAEVDLIVNYDVTASPIRAVQRNGRTGRKRGGRVVMLVMEGKRRGEGRLGA